MSSFLPAGELKLVYPRYFDLSKYYRSSSKCGSLEVCIEYPEELCELHNDYSLASDEIETKKKYCLNKK